MPSLIYVARITRSSEELAQGLQSAGHYVKSFAPGEITEDECLLVMTSDAVLAGLEPANAALRAGHTTETSQELVGIHPPPKMNTHLDAQAAIWNSLKTAAAKESATSRQQPSSVASKTASETENLGSIPGEAGLREFATLQESVETFKHLPVAQGGLSPKPDNPNHPPLSLLTEDKSRSSSAQTPATSRGMALLFGGRSRLVNGQGYSLFWQTMAIAASMLIFGAIRPSTTHVTAGDTKQPTQSDSGSKESTQMASGPRSRATIEPSKSPVTRSSTKVPKAAGAHRYQSDDDFVAEDLTNHFDRQAHGVANLQNSDLKRSVEGSVKKRVVFN
jgi:hypothetical protein